MNPAIHLGLLALVFLGRPVAVFWGRWLARRENTRYDNENGGTDQ